MKTGFLLPKDYADAAAHWVSQSAAQYGDLVISGEPSDFQPWAQQVWRDVKILPIESINAAAKLLRDYGQFWTNYSWNFHRRAALIQEKLPRVKIETLDFGTPMRVEPLGAWALLDRDTIALSTQLDIPYPLGIIPFVENRQDPPSRAYLKLWEAFTRFPSQPKSDDICLELGASPGGWTWVLANLGAQVIAVDRSPLAPELMKHPRVRFERGSAFAMQPRDVGSVDWIFSDIICYPKRLLTFVKRWLESGLCSNFLCTLKFQGSEQYDIIKEFLDIPGSQVVHLNQNKHELTWYRTEPSA